MAKKFETPIDLRQWELQNAVIQNLAADPGSGKPGQIYYNTATPKMRVCTNATGPVWADLIVVADATTGAKGIVQLTNDLAGTATAPVVQHFTLASDAAAGAHKITGLQDPSNPQDAMTKAYADANYLGSAGFLARDYKDSVVAVSTANAALATAYENGDTLDGVVLATGNRILLQNQTTTAENGIYTVNASGAPTRSTDAATGTQLTLGTRVYVEAGTQWAKCEFVYISGAFTAQVWTQGNYYGGGGQITGGTAGVQMTHPTAAFVQASTNFFTLNATGLGLNGRTPTAALDFVSTTTLAGGIGWGGGEFGLYRSASQTLKLSATALLDLATVARTDHGTAGLVSFGTAAADAMIKKDAAGVLGVKLGDDSAYAGIKATTIVGTTGTFSGSIAANGGLVVGAAQTISAGSNKITNVTDPAAAQDAATKNYVDNAVQGLSPKTAVRATTTGAETYTIAAGAVTQITGTTVDGVSPAVNDLILIKNAPTASGAGGGAAQTSTSFPANGIYIVTNATTNLTVSRATNADTWTEIVGALVPTIAGGTANGDTVWLSTTTPGGTLNTTAIAWTIFANATVIVGDNTYITRSGNTIQPVAMPVDPTAGANGTVVATAAALSRVMRFAIKGDGAVNPFTCTHNFGNRAVWAIGYTDSAGAPSSVVEIDYAPSSANAIAVTFPSVPTAGTIYYVEVIG